MISVLRAGGGVDHRAETAARLALVGGKMALERFEGAQIYWKGDDSMVTNADLEIQSWLLGEITEAFPEDGVLGEEGLVPGPSRIDAPYLWVLDPVDGTNNFGRGMPGFSVSVGVFRDGYPVAGAVYDPLGDQLFKASEGNGAWCNGRPLKVEPTPLSGRSLFTIRTPWPDGVPPWVEGWMRRYRLRPRARPAHIIAREQGVEASAMLLRDVSLARPGSYTVVATSTAKPFLHGVVIDGVTSRAYLEDPLAKRVTGYPVGDEPAGGRIQTIATGTR